MYTSTKQAISWLLFILDYLPVALPLALAFFGLVAVGLLLPGQLHDWLVWPLGLLAAAVAVFIATRAFRTNMQRGREWTVCNVLVFGGLLLWGAYNANLAGQHLITNRDPGTYANAGLWLINHPSLRITASTVFGNVTGISAESPGFSFGSSGYLQALVRKGTDRRQR